MKKNNKIYIFISIVFTAVSIYLLKDSSQQMQNRTVASTPHKAKPFKLKAKKVKKKSYFKKVVYKKYNNFKYNKKTTIPFKAAWETKAIDNIKNTLGKSSDVRVEFMGAGTYKINGHRKKVNKVKFYLSHKTNSKKSNFYAYVDENSGRIYQTWGATRHENFLPNESLKLKVRHH